MIKRDRSLFILVCVAMLLILSCGRSSDKSRVIAKVGKEKITENYLIAALRAKRQSTDYQKSAKEKNIKTLNGIIENIIFAQAARDAGLMNDEGLKRKADSFKKRIINQNYHELFLKNNGGQKTKDLIAWYNSNKDTYKDDSNNVPEFEDVKSKVVDDYLLSKADLKAHYTENIKSYTKYSKDDTTVTPFEEVEEKVKKSYLRKHKQELVANSKPNLVAKYNVEYLHPKPKVKEESLKEFYNKNNAKYMSKETYEIYHIEMDSEKGLKDVVSKVNTLDEFKAAATASSLNDWTKSKGGYVGVVKKSHVLPYGIGMFPKLFPSLDSLVAGSAALKKTVAMENPQTNKWHVFSVVKKMEPQLKAYDRVSAMVRQDFLKDNVIDIPADALLATYDKNRKVVEQDVLHLREEIPPHYQQRYTRQQLVEFIVYWDLTEMEAEKEGLFDDMDLNSVIKSELNGYWAKTYQDSVMKDTYGIDSATLASTFENNRELFMPGNKTASYVPQMNKSISVFLALEEGAMEFEYNIYPDKYIKDTVLMTYEEAKYKIFQNLKRKNSKAPREKFVEQLKEKYKVEILDTLFVPYVPTDPAAEFKLAQTFHTDRKLNDALKQYKRIREVFKDNKTLADSICMGVAQVYVEMEKYNDALAEYRRLLYLYPDSPNNYKAQFMIGFIYSENLKKEKKAVDAFKVLLEKYPECDLADDADWMVRNIESGGALMPKLDDS